MTPEVIAVGETMLTFVPHGADGIATATEYRAAIAGAESNVAAHMSAHGRRAAWASAVGDDPAGRRILTELADRGVDTTPVRIDASAATGVMLKDPGAGGSRVYYYRRGSAASQLDADYADGLDLTGVRAVHVSGVTPALSAPCARMLDRLFSRAADAGVAVSFDVNYRAGLWSVAEAAQPLLSFARRADICFVGRDEAEVLWGTPTAAAVRRLVAEPRLLVVKDGAVGATLFERGGDEVFVAAHSVEVVEPVGAGDAFAAGFLAGWLAVGDGTGDWVAALRLGHDTAARVLTTHADLPEPGEVAEPGDLPSRRVSA